MFFSYKIEILMVLWLQFSLFWLKIKHFHQKVQNSANLMTFFTFTKKLPYLLQKFQVESFKVDS
jgi:hypothetical protein